MLFALQLKLREALLPEVVSQVDHLEGQASSNGSRPQASSNGKKGKAKGGEGSERPLKSWAANPKLFPCNVAPEAQKLVDEVPPCSCSLVHDLPYCQAVPMPAFLRS